MITLPLTQNQTSLWLDDVISEDKSLYVIGGYADIRQHLDIEGFQAALQATIADMDALGITVHADNDRLVQVIATQPAYSMPVVDFSLESEPERACQAWIQQRLNTAFVLDQAPLYEFALLKAGDGHFFWMMKFHHLIMDTWSCVLLVNRLDHYYRHYTKASGLSPETPFASFEHYIRQENRYKGTADHAADRDYWVEKFASLPSALLDKKTEDFSTSTAIAPVVEKSWMTTQAQKEAIDVLAKQVGVSVPQFWMGIIATYFYRVTQKETLCFGLPIANRYNDSERHTVGLFSGVIPLLLNVSAESSFTDVLRQIKQTRRNDYPHQRFSLPELINEVRQTSATTTSLYDIAINIDLVTCQLATLQTEFIWTKRGAERKTPMTFFIKPIEDQQCWELKVACLPEYGSDSEMERLLARFATLVDAVLQDADQALPHLGWLPEAEQQVLLKDFNNTAADYPKDATIVSLFEAQVRKTPGNIAVSYEGQTLTYQELNERANRIAHHVLQHYAIQPDDIIALQLERSEWLPVGILGVLKAGAAYLPIGPDLPESRVGFMLQDCAVKALLTDDTTQVTAKGFEHIAPVLNLEVLSGMTAGNIANPQTRLQPRHLAYIIYTSGSTGKPKGVMLEHRNVVRLMSNERNLFDFNEHDVWSLFHYYGFDFSVWEIWGALLFGGRLVVVPKAATLNPELFADVLLTERVTVLNQVPSTFDQVQKHVLSKAQGNEQAMRIRYIIFGGSKLIPATLREWKTAFPKTRLINMYGITETTVHVTYKVIGEKEIQHNISNVGGPIPTLRCYILDAHRDPVPMGVVGEIYVAGDGLARGYLNNPELTAQRFIETRFAGETRLYKSGDSGRWLENGDIEFFGRLDFQLKIRGFRMEAGEIEQKLMEHPVIQSAAVQGKTIQGATELVAYIACGDATPPSLESLRAYVSKDLPAYMVPSYFIPLNTMPLTRNGKIDLKALPEPEGLSLTSGVEYIAPRNATEQTVVTAFAAILGIDTATVGINDDFFNLGGDSIKLIRLVGNIQRELGVKLPLSKVYSASKVVDLAAFITENARSLASEQLSYQQQQQALERQFVAVQEAFVAERQDAAVEAVFPMSDIQKGMIFGNLLYENEGVYHDQTVYDLSALGGSGSRCFDKTRFEQALALMVARHPNLRTAFHLDYQGNDIQVVYPSIDLPLCYQPTEHLAQAALETRLAAFLQEERQKGFEVEQAGLWRMCIFEADSEHPLLVLQFHHAIFDGWSLASFNTELLSIYHQLATNPAYQPEPLSLSYKDFVVRELITKQDQTIRQFWQQELADYERADLFTDVFMDDEYEVSLGTAPLKRLEALAAHYGVSVKMLTLAGYLLLLDFLSSQSESVIGIISTNRLPEEQGDQLLGCFLNSVPLRLPIDKGMPTIAFVQRVDEKIRSLRGKDQLTTMEIARVLGETSVSGNPVFDVIFNYIDFHIYDKLDAYGMQVEDMLLADLETLPAFFERTNTWFDLMVNTTGGELVLKVQLAKKLKASYSAEQVVNKYMLLLEQLQACPDMSINAIDLLGQQEREQLLTAFNPVHFQGEEHYAADQTVIDLFVGQAARTPDKVAVVFDGTELTYRQLEERSRQLAIHLRNQGVGTDTLVGLFVYRSLEMIIGILGILRAGGAYVPLDPDYPKDRIRLMLQDGIIAGNRDAGTSIILTQMRLNSMLAAHVADLGVRSLPLSERWDANDWLAHTAGDLTHRPAPDDLIYVIFTSGSTGKPKGTLVRHQGFHNLLHWYLHDFTFHDESRFLMVSSVNFDLTQKNLYAPLLLGGRLYLSSSENYDVVSITRLIEQHRITNINCTPSIFYGFVEQAAAGQFRALQSLEYVFLGGEPINLQKLADWFNHPNNQSQLVNSYGPTECSDVVSHYVIESSALPTIPVGKPICNTQLYVLDADQNLTPLGVQGELHIGGKGLGRGYLNNPELTAEKFIAHPFKPGELLYKTGDMARVLPDGNIDFLGRLDHQLKIRGHRIETGEIQDVLQKHPAIKSAIVVGKEIDGHKELAAYFTAGDTEQPALEALRAYLAGFLPDYMIPAYFVGLETFPLTPSGKVDSRALPDPVANSLGAGIDYVAPRTPTEQTLSGIWERVLQQAQIGAHDNFFDRGGHSLKAIRVVSLIQQSLGIHLKLSDIFAYPTLSALAAHLDTQQTGACVAIEPVAEQEHYAVSNAQRRLWLLAQMEEQQTVYNMPLALRLKGSLSVDVLQVSLEALLARHEILRTNIITVAGQPRQLVHETAALPLSVTCFSGDTPKQLAAHLLAFAQRPFDLANDRLFRAELMQVNDDEHVLLLNLHHIIFDGWSTPLLLQELKQLYEAGVQAHDRVADSARTLEPLSLHYKDYAAWHNALLEDDALLSQLRHYWHQQLAPGEEGIPVLQLPEDYPRPVTQGYQGDVLRKTLPLSTLQALEQFSQSAGATLFMCLTAIVKVLLYRYSGQRDIWLGTLSAGRVHPSLDQQLGFYVNTLVLRDYLDDGIDFSTLLAKVRQTSTAAIEHELYPFDLLVEELAQGRDRSRSPLFDVLMVFEEDPGALALGEMSATLEPVDWQTSKFDLSFGFKAGQQGLVIDIEYNTALYKAARIKRMLEHVACLIDSVLNDAGQAVDQLNMLPADEKQHVLTHAMGARRDYPLDQTITRMIEAQVNRTPDNIAVVFEGRELSYRDLNHAANRLAHYLLEHFAIQPDEVIALQVERSEWMIIALLGVLKAGAAYLPIAPDYPANRTTYMLEDSSARLLLADASVHAAAVTAFSGILPVVAVETAQSEMTENPVTTVTARHLAYIIYTSGSTGQPKGVMLEHRGVVNMLYGQLEQLAVTEQDRTLQFAPYTFDASVPEFFMGMCAGTTMVLVSRETLLSAEAFQALMQQHRITLADIPPAYLAVLDEAALDNVRLLITAGEAAISSDVKKYVDKLQYVNIYGPTETTVVVSSFHIPATYHLGQNVPIGRPVPNMNIYIVDEHLQVVPLGVPGELVIGGVGVARGYVNNPELSAGKFVASPFHTDERLYRTGDLGRWLDDGNIEFLGRIDHQLKIRGHRIEADEIKEALLQHALVRSAVVVGKQVQGVKELVAYLVTEQGAEPELAVLRGHLAETLPDYMIPAYFVVLDTLPLTRHEKVDLKALPEPDADNTLGTQSYTAPRNAMEILLAGIWEDVLQRPGIGIHDNFFHIGGDSIKALQITGRLGAQELSLSIKMLFLQPTIAQLATLVTRKAQEYPQERFSGEVPLTATQSWFFREINTDRQQFNQAFFLSARQALDAVLLQQSLQAVVDQHDLLRATYTANDAGVVRQVIRDRMPVDVQVIRLGEADDADQVLGDHAHNAQAGFELSAGPLIKAILFRKAEGDEVLLVIHHLVVDGVSWRILLEDLTMAYRQLADHQPVRLPPKTAPFAWWSDNIREYVNSSAGDKQRRYWETVLQLPVSALPVDHPDKPNRMADSAVAQFRLDKGQTTRLTEQSHRAYNTEMNDVLLCALSRALHQVFAGKHYQITLEGHGREPLFEMDISRTVGWFTSVFPVVLDYAAEPGEHLQATKESLRRIPHKGMDYLLVHYLSDQAFTQAARDDISFNYLGQFDQQQDHLLAFSDRSAGAAISPAIERDCELDVLGMVIDGELQLSLTYGKQRMNAERIEALATAFRQELIQLTTHCIAQQTPVYTPADFTDCTLSLSQYRKFLLDNALSADDIEDIYTLSPLQEGMLFHKLMEPDSPAYFNQVELVIDTELDVPHFVQCWERILAAYPVLRTSFFSAGLTTPLQVVRKAVALDFSQHNLSGQTPGQQEHSIQEYIRADRQRDFTLREPSLLRLALFRTNDAQYRLVVSDSHIIMDGWSQATLLQELRRLYRRDTDKLSIRAYSPYIRWLKTQSAEESRGFWQEYLAGYEETAAIPALGADHAQEGMDSQRVCLTLTETQTRELEALAKACSVSLNTVIQGVWAVVLGRYTRKQDVVFGMTTSGRSAPVPDIEALCGLFINTLPLRVRWSADDTFTDLLTNIQQSAAAIQEHEHDSLAMIQSVWEGEGELFTHLIAFENYPAEAEAPDAQHVLNLRHVNGYDPVHYDFSLVVAPGRQLQIFLNYNRHTLGTEWVNRMKSHVQTALESVLTEPDRAIQRIGILPASEQQLVLQTFNQTAADYPHEQTLISLFEAQVARTPDNIAVTFDARALRYHELNAYANRVAHHLLQVCDIQPDDVVGLQSGRDEWLLVGILGILKAGAAYLPMGTDLPEARVTFMLEDSAAKALLVHDVASPGAGHPADNCFVFDLKQLARREGINDLNPCVAVQPHHLAYIIYTSGSTGKPKGVMIEHRNVVRLMKNDHDLFGFTQRDVWSLFHYHGFDFSVWEIWGALLFGGRLVVVPKAATLDPESFAELLISENVTVLNQVPSTFDQVQPHLLKKIQDETCIRYIIFGGSKLSPATLHHWKTRFPATRLINMYGITETTVHVTYKEIGDADIASNISNVGKPIPTLRCYILDEHLRPVPLGVVGEIYVAGDGLARGYLNNPALTADRFIADGIAGESCLYKSGDSGRWLANGDIEFFGRLDFQLKIRGFRIEAGEIEQKLLAHTAIDSATVLGKEVNGTTELVAYIACEGEAAPSLASLRAYLAEDLPAYMVPAYFVNLEHLPLNANGKVDRKALPEVSADGLMTGDTYVAPRTDTEQWLVGIWQQVLERETVSVNDNFFHLGGHSLKAIRLLGQLQDKLALQLPLQLLFRYPVLAEQAAQLDLLQLDGQAGSYPHGMRFNPDARPTLFTFPPFFGLSVWYQRLAEHLVDISFYCFDFLPDENRLEMYYQQIKREQPQGPYLLFGYSAGGSLAYAMAAYLEAQGETVSSIIMGDSMVVSDMQTDMEGYLDDLATALSTREDAGASGLLELVQNKQLRPQTLQRLRSYEDFLNTCRDQGVQSDIHLIKAEFEASIPNMHQRWNEFTRGNCYAHQATGSHDYLFEAEHLDGNAALLQQIIEQSLLKANV